MARAIIGLFNTQVMANAALRDLSANGFADDKLGLVVKDVEQGGTLSTAEADMALRPGRTTEDAVTGGILGGALGAFLAVTGALVIPGIGPFIAGGVLITLLGGGAGWLIGGLAGLGIPEEDARYYQEQVESGRALVSVLAGDQEEDAVRILLRHGGEVNRLGGTSLPVEAEERTAPIAIPEGYQPAVMSMSAGAPADMSAYKAGAEIDPKGPVAVPPDVKGLPTDANPVPLSPTDPKRATSEGQPFLDDVNPFGRGLRNREGRPLGGVGVANAGPDPAM
ncbi:MAG TPA: hypothetical protein VNL71_24240 [Chloroflexota bacterium]|nr:hypothetical protein [Chloroflexota bacterium]